MVPHGLTQSVTKCPHPPETAAKPSTVPSAIPIRIVIYSGNFFIVCNRQPFPIRDFHGTEAYARPDLVSGKSQTNITQNPGTEYPESGRSAEPLITPPLPASRDVCRFLPASVTAARLTGTSCSLYAPPAMEITTAPADRKPPDRIFGPLPSRSGIGSFSISRSINVSIRWNLSCSCSLTNDPGTGRTRTGRTTNPVDVIFRVVRHVVIDHRTDILDVDSARHNVRSHEDIDLTVAEIEHHRFSLLLFQIGMHRADVQLHLLQRARASSLVFSFDDEKIIVFVPEGRANNSRIIPIFWFS